MSNFTVNNLNQYNLLQLLKSSLLDLGCDNTDFSDQLLNQLWCLEYQHNDTLTYFAVRLKLLEFLMARRFRSIDNFVGKGRGLATSKQESHSDRNSNSLGTEFADSYDEEAGVSRSDEINKSKTKDSGITEANSCNLENHRSIGRDLGYGKGYGYSDSAREGANIDLSSSHTEYNGTTTGGGNKVGCNWSRSEEFTESDSKSKGDSPSSLIFTVGRSYSVSSAYSNSAWSKGLYDASKQSETSVRRGSGNRSVNNNSASYSEAKGESGNWFQGNQNQHSQRASGSNSDDYAAHVKRSWTYGYGSGESYSKADSWNESGTKLKSKTTYRADSSNESNASDNFHYYAYKNNQLFKNLQIAYEVTLANYTLLYNLSTRMVGTSSIESSFKEICKLPNYEALNYARINQNRVGYSILYRGSCSCSLAANRCRCGYSTVKGLN